MPYQLKNVREKRKMTLGGIIKNYRESHDNMSMDEFASKSGISKAYIGLLEKNKHPKTGKEIKPSLEIVKQAARAMNMEYETLLSRIDSDITLNEKQKNIIPIYGCVAAGIPIDAIEDIIDMEEISYEMARKGEFFGVRIKGDSMMPDIHDGDYAIVKKQSDAETDQIVIARINGDEGCCKKLIKYPQMISLMSLNPKYNPMNFSNEEIISKPVEIVGVVVEIRRKMV